MTRITMECKELCIYTNRILADVARWVIEVIAMRIDKVPLPTIMVANECE